MAYEIGWQDYDAQDMGATWCASYAEALVLCTQISRAHGLVTSIDTGIDTGGVARQFRQLHQRATPPPR